MEQWLEPEKNRRVWNWFADALTTLHDSPTGEKLLEKMKLAGVKISTSHAASANGQYFPSTREIKINPTIPGNDPAYTPSNRHLHIAATTSHEIVHMLMHQHRGWSVERHEQEFSLGDEFWAFAVKKKILSEIAPPNSEIHQVIPTGHELLGYYPDLIPKEKADSEIPEVLATAGIFTPEEIKTLKSEYQEILSLREVMRERA